MKKHVWWVSGLSVLLVVVLGRVLLADARDDLSRAKSDFESLRSRIDDVKDKVEHYLDESVKLRQMDKDQLAELINQICRLDIERDDDEADRLAKELKDKIVDRVRHAYDDTVDHGSHVFDELGHIEGDARQLRDRVHDLEDQPDIKDDAEHLLEEVDEQVNRIHEMMDNMNRDISTLDRVKEGVMAGANNPTIRARMEYGKEMHKKLQESCHEKEVELSSGRPDCIMFDEDNCKVIEFKPDTYSSSVAEDQAERYVPDVREKFKDDERAKKCKHNTDGPIFEAVAQLYPACRP